MRKNELLLNLQQVQEQIKVACLSAGRNVDEVSLCVASKLKPVEDMLILNELGVQTFGENYVREMIEKSSKIRHLDLVLIGHLQTNKVTSLIAQVPQLIRIESIDSSKLAAKVNAGQRT